MKKRTPCLIILYNQDKVLLQHRDNNTDHLAGYWALFGGGLEKDETPEEAVRREAYEELEYKLKNPEFFEAQEFSAMGVYGTKHVFIEQYDTNQKLVLHEGQGMGWWNREELRTLKIVDHDRELLERVIKYILSKA